MVPFASACSAPDPRHRAVAAVHGARWTQTRWILYSRYPSPLTSSSTTATPTSTPTSSSLLHHSGYFCNHLSVTASAGKVEKDEAVVEWGRRRRVTTFSSEVVSFNCQHPAYVLCIHLPQNFGDGRLFTEDDFLPSSATCTSRRLSTFPRSNPSAPSSTPSPKTPPPASPSLPMLSSISLQWRSTRRRVLRRRTSCGTTRRCQRFHYFDCQQAMQRSEQVIIRGNLSCESAWVWLPLAVRHKMNAVENACIVKLGRYEDVGKRSKDQGFLDTQSSAASRCHRPSDGGYVRARINPDDCPRRRFLSRSSRISACPSCRCSRRGHIRCRSRASCRLLLLSNRPMLPLCFM